MALFSSDVYMPPTYTDRVEYENNQLRERIRILSNELKKVELPERYIINDGATILFWKDGSKTVVKRAKDDEFNPRLAFLTAFFQHYCGMSKNKANKYLANLQIENEKQRKGCSLKIGDTVELIDDEDEITEYSEYVGRQGIIMKIYEKVSEPYADVKFKDGKMWFPFIKNLKKVGGK